MNYCPDWIFDACTSRAAQDFLTLEMPLNAVGKKYAGGLSEVYTEVRLEEIVAGAEDIVRFLAEVDAGDASADILRGFTYYRVKFEGLNKPRKLKSMFSSADDAVKEKKYSAEEAVKKFKAYVFAVRSDSAPIAPAGWKIEDETELEHLSAVAARPLSILDSF